MRIGINSELRNTMDQTTFVLSKFSLEEEKKLIELEPVVREIINDYVNERFDIVMNKYNHRK